MAKSREDLTPEERKIRADRARENGRKGGRPPKSPWNPVQRIAAAARAKGEAVLPFVVDYLIELVKGEHDDATHDNRIRAAEFIANRCGLPVRTELMVGGDDEKPIRIVNALGWRDSDGTLRDADGAAIEENGSARDDAGRAETPTEH